MGPKRQTVIEEQVDKLLKVDPSRRFNMVLFSQT